MIPGHIGLVLEVLEPCAVHTDAQGSQQAPAPCTCGGVGLAKHSSAPAGPAVLRQATGGAILARAGRQGACVTLLGPGVGRGPW
jgi:hypothetical protein